MLVTRRILETEVTIKITIKVKHRKKKEKKMKNIKNVYVYVRVYTRLCANVNKEERRLLKILQISGRSE